MGLSVEIPGPENSQLQRMGGKWANGVHRKSAVTLHGYENLCIIKAMEMTMLLLSHRFDLEYARWGFKSGSRGVGLS